MDFKDAIKQLSDRIVKLKDNIQTEEATKNAFVMPFIQYLGYDVFNPLEVVPEFTCDIGIKKGEKVDYAILKDGCPIILIECKNWNQDLTLHDNQLLRYFHVANAKFGVLTNGIIYRFYTDLEASNKMDEKPFLEVNLLDMKSNQIDELKKFHKTYFDVDNILSSASELKYTGELKSLLKEEFENPSPEFVKLLSKKVYDGVITSKILEQFTSLVKKSISGLISDTISERLKSALNSEKIEQEKNITDNSNTNDVINVEDKIVTTDEEIEAFYIVKSILRPKIANDRIYHRDALSYFTIIIDNNNRKPICRLYLDSPTNKQIGFINEDKKEIKYKIQSIDDIYNYVDDILKAASKYLD